MQKIKRMIGIGIVLSVLLTGCGKSAATCFSQGISAASKGSTEEAIQLLLQATEKNPEKAEYYIELGIVQTVAGQNEEARQTFSKAIVEKELPITLKNNKNAYRGIAVTYYQETDYVTALSWLEKAIEIKEVTGVEDDLQRYYARCLRQLLRYEDAIKIYSTLIEKHPDEAALYEEQAELYRLSGQSIDALRNYDKILELEPDNYAIYFEKFESWMAEGNSETAKSVLQKVLEIKEPNGLESFYIAKAQFILEQPDAMDKLLRSAADGFLRAYFYVGELYYQKGNWQDALTYYELAKEPTELPLSVEQGIHYYRMAECCYKLANYEQAVQYASQAESCVTVEQKQTVQRLKIIALEKLGNYEQAYEQLLAYQEQYPEDTAAQKELDFIELRWSRQ